MSEVPKISYSVIRFSVVQSGALVTGMMLDEIRDNIQLVKTRQHYKVGISAAISPSQDVPVMRHVNICI